MRYTEEHGEEVRRITEEGRVAFGWHPGAPVRRGMNVIATNHEICVHASFGRLR